MEAEFDYFSNVYDKHSSFLYGFIASFVNEDVAGKALTNAFIEILSQHDNRDLLTNEHRSWMLGIACACVSDLLKKDDAATAKTLNLTLIGITGNLERRAILRASPAQTLPLDEPTNGNMN